jgi:hypothetical protein
MEKVFGRALSSSELARLRRTLEQLLDHKTLMDIRARYLQTGSPRNGSSSSSEKTTRYSFTLANGRKVWV